ncbi:twin-arginine translocase subunit TatC [Listeria booriae]|uniref:Sec-independent protein translocase protein TatC n=1 Tax=Listeria booriae TaxID=1552123 RepID=A0A7X1A4A1_9LIST|nr:twin-arginine translocase subunit TatC [Listeria booriae]MBC1227147.1 twin-arginine translocase subunit TatC [Listeria booriae]MBC1230761.1 twin-arginine translocase subunit TatC [Listeria booriae]MBC1551587.1 twin-arginine translocase subunit TatC [Listeria booriae]MBC1559922.1 twin-arginine translocase subunit TatC [Listeria booriae]MBC1562006.1 twin-arginine translocase subunit TatC [Listeria booriae]
MTDRSMPLTKHLQELRARLIFVFIAFFVSFIIGMLVAKPLILFLQTDEMPVTITMNVFKVTDAFSIYMQFAFVIALVLIAPFALYQLWAFVKPGLYRNEQQATLRYIPIICVLFLIGVAFSYFVVFPFVLTFMLQFGEQLGVQNTIGLTTYFQFMLQTILPFGALFQMPLLVAFLTRLGLINPDIMRRFRKYAYFILLVIAGLITPPELLSHLLVTLPLILLYEFSIIISSLTYRKLNAKIS